MAVLDWIPENHVGYAALYPEYIPATMPRNLKEDVTIVISVKDTYYIAGPQLDAVLEAAPGVPVIRPVLPFL